MNTVQPGQRTPLRAPQQTFPFRSGAASSAFHWGAKKWLLSGWACVFVAWFLLELSQGRLSEQLMAEAAEYTGSISADCRWSRILLLPQKQHRTGCINQRPLKRPEVLRALSLRAASIAREPSGRACWECPEVVRVAEGLGLLFSSRGKTKGGVTAVFVQVRSCCRQEGVIRSPCQ